MRYADSSVLSSFASSGSSTRLIFFNAQTVFRLWGEYLDDVVVMFGDDIVYRIYQLDRRVYRLAFYQGDSGIIVPASLMLKCYVTEGR